MRRHDNVWNDESYIYSVNVPPEALARFSPRFRQTLADGMAVNNTIITKEYVLSNPEGQVEYVAWLFSDGITTSYISYQTCTRSEFYDGLGKIIGISFQAYILKLIETNIDGEKIIGLHNPLKAVRTKDLFQ